MRNPVDFVYTWFREINNLLWRTPLNEMSRRRSILFRQLRIIVLAGRGFAEDKVQLRASALTFYTLLSIIPMVALAFGLAKGFGLDQDLESVISKWFSGQQEVMDWVINNARVALNNTKGLYIAGAGVIILFWSVMQLLDNIESSFNHIWQIRSARPWMRKLTDYITIMLVAPVLIILTSSATVFITTSLEEFLEASRILESFKPLVSFAMKLIPYVMMWIILTVTYMVMPNTKVKFSSALVAGILAGTLFQLVQWFYIDLQVSASRLGALYGSFAAFPLFLIWIQMSWLIVLLGAEISFANQNVNRYEFESDSLHISSFHKRRLVVLIMKDIVNNFSGGGKPPSAEMISSNLKIPVRIARELLHDLGVAGLVSAVYNEKSKEKFFQPALDINKITVGFVISKLDRVGTDHTIAGKDGGYDTVTMMLEEFDNLIHLSEYNRLIKDIK